MLTDSFPKLAVFRHAAPFAQAVASSWNQALLTSSQPRPHTRGLPGDLVFLQDPGKLFSLFLSLTTPWHDSLCQLGLQHLVDCILITFTCYPVISLRVQTMSYSPRCPQHLVRCLVQDALNICLFVRWMDGWIQQFSNNFWLSFIEHFLFQALC